MPARLAVSGVCKPRLAWTHTVARRRVSFSCGIINYVSAAVLTVCTVLSVSTATVITLAHTCCVNGYVDVHIFIIIVTVQSTGVLCIVKVVCHLY